MENILIQDKPLFEILNAVNLGLFRINEISNVRIYNKLDPSIVIIPVTANIEDDILKFIETEQIVPKKVEFTTLDYIAIKMTDEGDLINYSLLELIVTTSSDENLTLEWDFKSPHYYCKEINYIDELDESKQIDK